jgi:hypothetical protein
MKSLHRTIEAWRDRRRPKFQEWWSHRRAKGKLWFVLWTIAWFNVMMFALNQGVDYLMYRTINTTALPLKLSIVFIASVVLALWSWSWNESKFEDHWRRAANRDER